MSRCRSKDLLQQQQQPPCCSGTRPHLYQSLLRSSSGSHFHTSLSRLGNWLPFRPPHFHLPLQLNGIAVTPGVVRLWRAPSRLSAAPKENLPPRSSAVKKKTTSPLIFENSVWSGFFFWGGGWSTWQDASQSVQIQRRRARAVIRKMGFIHMLMSQHTNHILFNKRKARSVPGGQSRRRGTTV